jgi:hypothetical protein
MASSAELARFYLFITELPDASIELFSQNPVEFHHFKELPTELRFKIWHLARQRTLTVTIDQHSCFRNVIRDVPVTFHVNRESRQETMRCYSPPVQSLQYPLQTIQSALHQDYFDPQVDTLRFPDTAALDFYMYTPITQTEDLSNIQMVEIDSKNWEDVFGLEWEDLYDEDVILYTVFTLFERLKVLSLVRGGIGLMDLRQVDICVARLDRYFEDFATSEHHDEDEDEDEDEDGVGDEDKDIMTLDEKESGVESHVKILVRNKDGSIAPGSQVF